MKKKIIFSLIGVGLSLAKIILSQMIRFSYKKRFEKLKLSSYPHNEALRFAVITDFRGGDKLNSGERIANDLLKEKLDFVLFMGNLFHKKNKNEEVTALLNKLGDLPVIYAPRESKATNESEAMYFSELSRSGVKILENSIFDLNSKKGQVSILGLLGKKKSEDIDDYEGRILPQLKKNKKNQACFRIALGNHFNNFHLYRLLDTDLILVSEIGKGRDVNSLGLFKRLYWGLKKVNKRKFYLNGTPFITINGFLQGYFLPKLMRCPEVLIIEVDKMSNLYKKS